MKHGCYELKLVSLDREQLIARIQNQRVEINNMHEWQRRSINYTLEQGCRIRTAMVYLKEKRPECALGVLRDHVTDGNEILREIANG